MMCSRSRLSRHCLLFLISATSLATLSRNVEAQNHQAEQNSQTEWTLDSAIEHLEMYPNDAYLQYVAMQLAIRKGVEKEFATKIRTITSSSRPEWRRRNDSVNLFSLFTGTLAIQESLQLEVMAGAPVNPRDGADANRIAQPEERENNEKLVIVDTLEGPSTKSHPWEEMLGKQARKVAPIASYIPEDQYYIRFQSVGKLLDVLSLSDQWGEHLISQSNRKAYSSQVSQDLMRQLAVEVNDVIKPFYDLVVKEVVATGNDLYLTRGSDMTLLFRFEQPLIFKAQMDAFLVNAERNHPGATRGRGNYKGVSYVSLTAPHRRVNVFYAYVGDDLHLRSNSLTGLQRVIDTIQGQADERRPSLADSVEFAYMRTLMPLGAKEEDGLIYLSDPFIRRLTGPTLKLTERRRVLCYNHLRMISHACALYESENGEAPESIDDLLEKQCLPPSFGDKRLACPSGGEYSLNKDGTTGICSHHGEIGSLKPCCEIAVEIVSKSEAEEYKQFVTSYERYWRTFFDPIAIRVSVQPDEYRMETIILPLINNSLYQGMASTLGGEPMPLETGPVPDRNIFSIGFQIDKQKMLARSGFETAPEQQADAFSPSYLFEVSAQRMRQIGLAMHNYHDTYGSLPTVASHNDQGQQLLSWRVHLLPFLGQDALYKKFHLDEPWSSPHNRKLIQEIPDVYAIPGEKKQEGRTTYQVVVGENTLFTGDEKGIKMRDVRDGLSNTVLFVDTMVKEAKIWTQPEDVKANDTRTANMILSKYDQRTLIAMADGSVRFITDDIQYKQIASAMTRSGGEDLRNFGTTTTQRRNRRSGFAYWLTNVRGGQVDEKLTYDFLSQGLKNQVGLHVYDSDPTFDFQLTRFMGQMLGSFSTSNRFDDDLIPIFMLIASLNSPVYASIPLDDVEITDRFIEHVDDLLAPVARKAVRTGWFQTENDFYKIPITEEVLARTECISLGPIKWRFFWARIGKQLYIASKPEVLKDIAELHAKARPADEAAGTAYHAMVRVRPQNWNQTLDNFKLGWAENHRQACFDNVGRLSSLSDLAVARDGKANYESRPETLYGLNFYCPCGGQYHHHGEHLECSVHGSAYNPMQAAIGSEKGSINNVLSDFGGMTVGLTFLEDGLHATLTVKRK